MLTRQEKLAMVASLAEIVAAVGVMISIIYLAIQVSQSNTEAQLQTHNDTLALMHSPIEQFLAQPDLAEIVRTGGISPDELSEADWFRFGYYYLMQFNMYDFLYFAYLDGTAVSQLWIGTDNSWRHIFRNEPGVRRAWREWRHAFADPFQSYVDTVVAESEKSAR
ncbi:MAG: hypothetical protein R3192_05620 [Woeseiaceae bacterium]|nr:hypothetical protein [Woeseiaceae bacterium]